MIPTAIDWFSSKWRDLIDPPSFGYNRDNPSDGGMKMALRLFYIAVLLAMMTILPFLPASGLPAEGTEPAVAKVPKRKELKEVRGKIVKLDPVTKRIRILAGIFSRVQEVKITAQTEIMLHGWPATFSDLRAGDKVRVVSLASDDEQKAESIDVL
jgi:hypothetical protein